MAQTGRIGTLVSVVLPFRDRSDVLGRAIRSVLSQTYTELELILVDDQSRDGSSEVAATFSDPRIKHVRTDHPSGASGARNVGIELAAGRYLAFQDSDDEWMPRKLEVQLDVLSQHAGGRDVVGAAGCRRTLFGSRLPAEWKEDVILHTSAEVLGGCVPGSGTPTLLVDRHVTREAARFLPDMPCYEERDYLYQALGGRCVAVVQAPLIRVERGRTDHVSHGRNALVGLEVILRRYQDELSSSPRIREWYHYAAMREALRCGDHPAARHHLARAGSNQKLRIWAEYGLGRLFGERGLAAVAKAGVRPDYADRCLPPGSPA